MNKIEGQKEVLSKVTKTKKNTKRRNMGKDKVSYNSACASISLCKIGRLLCWNNASIIGKFFESIPHRQKKVASWHIMCRKVIGNMTFWVQNTYELAPFLDVSYCASNN